MKVGILTLGCKVNMYESEFVANILKNNGLRYAIFMMFVMFILLILVQLPTLQISSHVR